MVFEIPFRSVQPFNRLEVVAWFQLRDSVD
jgi:hypothetical protein